MSYYRFAEERFFEYAMELFSKAGHAVTTNPEFVNHFSDQLVYFDCKKIVSLSKNQRDSLRSFSNISRLFEFNNCVFFSIVLLTRKKNRSQAAHDVHTMLHAGIGARGTVCIFKCDDEIMLSFMGFGLKCVLSDWYPIDDDFDVLLDRLHIVNMSLYRDIDYFSDMVYSLARDYYFTTKDPTVYELIPVDYFAGKSREDIDRDELNQIVINELQRVQLEYGDDYVEYDDSLSSQETGINADLDMMLLEIDDADQELGDSFDEEIDKSNDDTFDDEYERDEYEFGNMNPEIFKDPSLMVKFLEKAATTSSKESDGFHLEDESKRLGEYNTNNSDDLLISLLDEEGIHYVDNREKGGALWIIGGHEFDGVIETCEDLGFHFIYTETGGRATNHLPGWYLRN